MATSIKINIKSKVFKTNNSKNKNYSAIRKLNFNIPKGEFCSIIGPSGCGKTTLLNLISGLDKSVNGKIIYDNKKNLKDIKTAYMFQNPRLLPWLTVLENVEVVLSKEQKNSNKAKEILTIMGLKNFLGYYPSQLSGGMQRRVALARSFSSQPELFLLDEPFVSLDDGMANKLRDMLISLWTNEPTTIIFVTHDLREAIYLADRIIFLSAAPSRVLLEKKIHIKRPRRLDDGKVESLRKNIISKNKKILTGVMTNA